jgi:hypothetical protein
MDNIQEEDSNEGNQEITNKSHNKVEYAVVHENKDNEAFESYRELDENHEQVKENHDKVEENHKVLDENRDEIIQSLSYETFEYQEKVEKSSNNNDDNNNNELSYAQESKTTIENGDKDSNIDSAIDVKHDSGQESPSVEDFGNKLRMWSTQSLNRSTYRQTSWYEEQDKFKTLRQIKKGNTRLLMEKFQFL